MKNEIRKVYFCDHCKKHNLSASSISRHEKYCRSNPENKHKCFALCSLLKKDRTWRGHFFKTEFTCIKTGEKMYSYQMEKVQSIYPFHNMIDDGLIRMPLKCEHFVEMTLSEQETRFGTESFN